LLKKEEEYWQAIMASRIREDARLLLDFKTEAGLEVLKELEHPAPVLTPVLAQLQEKRMKLDDKVVEDRVKKDKAMREYFNQRREVARQRSSPGVRAGLQVPPAQHAPTVEANSQENIPKEALTYHGPIGELSEEQYLELGEEQYWQKIKARRRREEAQLEREAEAEIAAYVKDPKRDQLLAQLTIRLTKKLAELFLDRTNEDNTIQEEFRRWREWARQRSSPGVQAGLPVPAVQHVPTVPPVHSVRAANSETDVATFRKAGTQPSVGDRIEEDH
jgi:hypothetical protein